MGNPIKRREFDEIEYFYLINAWASYEDSQESNFDDVTNDRNELFGYDARKFTKVWFVLIWTFRVREWIFLILTRTIFQGMVNHTEIQYEKGHSCERTDAPTDQGCLVKKGSQLDFDKKSCSVQLSGLISD